jgi:hypothetical protein
MEEMADSEKEEKPLRFYHSATLFIGIIALIFTVCYYLLKVVDGWIVPAGTILFIIPSISSLILGVTTFIKRPYLAKTQFWVAIIIILFFISMYWIKYSTGK